MNQSLVAICTVIPLLYMICAVMQYGVLVGYVRWRMAPIWLIGMATVALHAVWLHHVVDLAIGQNINFFNMCSFLLWVMSLLVVLMSWHKLLRHLAVFIYPMAALSVVAVMLFPGHPVIRTMHGHLSQSAHILLAMLSCGVICIAVLQAILLYLQDRLLHHYTCLPELIKKLPALESMERVLFQLLLVGFILLTVLCLSSIYVFPAILQPPLLKKTLLVFITWSVLFVLLLGRYVFGWRGRRVVGCTLVSFFLLIIIYFCS